MLVIGCLCTLLHLVFDQLSAIMGLVAIFFNIPFIFTLTYKCCYANQKVNLIEAIVFFFKNLLKIMKVSILTSQFSLLLFLQDSTLDRKTAKEKSKDLIRNNGKLLFFTNFKTVTIFSLIPTILPLLLIFILAIFIIPNFDYSSTNLWLEAGAQDPIAMALMIVDALLVINYLLLFALYEISIIPIVISSIYIYEKLNTNK
jgi:hypothetical protein